MDIFLKITFEYFMVLFLGIQYFHGIVNYRLETSKFFISLIMFGLFQVEVPTASYQLLL